MSSKLLDRIWDHYPEGGGELLTAIALAEHGDPDGTNIYPSVETIARMTRQSERTVQYHLRKMQETNWLLMVEKGGGRNKPTKYRIPLERIPQHALITAQKLHRLDVVGHAGTMDALNGAENGATAIAPISPKGCKYGANTVQFDPLNGATAIAPDQGTKTKTKEHTLPSDFALTDELRAWAKEKGYAHVLEAHFDYFLDWARAGAHKRTDWPATFRNCVRADWGDVRRNLTRPGAPKPPQVVDTACSEEVAGERCGMPGSRYGDRFLCEGHRAKRLERKPMPANVRARLGIGK